MLSFIKFLVTSDDAIMTPAHDPRAPQKQLLVLAESVLTLTNCSSHCAAVVFRPGSHFLRPHSIVHTPTLPLHVVS